MPNKRRLTGKALQVSIFENGSHNQSIAPAGVAASYVSTFKETVPIKD